MREERLEIRLLKTEKQEIAALAKQARISAAEVIRRTTLGRTLPNTLKHEAVIELVRINNDLARLGNLLRMVLMDEDEDLRSETTNLQKLYEDIRDTQTELKTKIKAL